ncbi:hypothetical protein KFK09_005465 [Dendrobium nobile]|uniref:Uncharacterized protein n=1 Tax=Dendrobium nobile TaxID=94219 RepID=A0A8T3C125_DENNO|nr:hypothetical protein KFK09_005465 [Dendrobium nobile]
MAANNLLSPALCPSKKRNGEGGGRERDQEMDKRGQSGGRQGWLPGFMQKVSGARLGQFFGECGAGQDLTFTN